LWLNQLHIAEQIGIVRVIRQRKCSIALVTMNSTRIECPTCKNSGPTRLNTLDESRAIHMRRAKQNAAGKIISPIKTKWRQVMKFVVIDLRHLIDAGMQPDRQIGTMQCSENFL